MENAKPSPKEIRIRASAEGQQLFMVVRPDACPICEMHRAKIFWADEAPSLPIAGCLKHECLCEYRRLDPNGPTLGEMLDAGIAAIKTGQMDEAQEWLVSLLQIDRYNEKAWLWLSGAADSDQDRLECLQEVLNINPENSHAKRGLSALLAKDADETDGPVTPSDNAP